MGVALLDRHGVRAIAEPASLLVGLGSSVAYLGVIYLSLIWLPPQRHGMVPGMVTAVGSLSAATAQLPLLLISESFGWRMSLLLCAVAGLMIAMLI